MKQNRYIPSDLPLHVRENPKHRAEVVVFDALKQQLDLRQRDWVVAWSASWISKPKPAEPPRVGEADFVLAHPKSGLIIVEVKGGRIQHRNGQWYSVDADGVSHEIDPFHQVERNAFELAWKFNQLKRWSPVPREKYARWVIFPDSAMPRGVTFPTDVALEMITDSLGMRDIVGGLLSAAKFWYGTVWDHPAATKVPDLLIEIFDKPLQFTLPLAARSHNEHAEIERLTDSQFRVISAVAGCSRVAVAGGAGSGKTWLARKRAVQLANEGFRVLLTCKSKPLTDHLLEITDEHENLVICDYDGLLGRLGGNTTGIDNDSYAWKLADFVMENPSLSFDAVMVDEGQDFLEREWEYVELLLGSEKQGIFYIFYDDNQQLGTHTTMLPSGMIPLYLEDNVRTTRSIHQDMAKLYSGKKPQRPQGPLGMSVEHVSSNGKPEQALRQIISRLLTEERFSPDDISVLTPVTVSESRFANMSLANGIALQKTPRPNRDIALTSISDFKGLENAVVIVVETDKLGSDAEVAKRQLYTAFSRPRSQLIVLDYSGSFSF